MLRLVFAFASATAIFTACGGSSEDGQAEGDSPFGQAFAEAYGDRVAYGACLDDMMVDYAGGAEELRDEIDFSEPLLEQMEAILAAAFAADPEQASACSELFILHLIGLDVSAGIYNAVVQEFLEGDGDSTPFCLVLGMMVSDGRFSDLLEATSRLESLMPSTPRPGQTANPDDAEVAANIWLDECARELDGP